LHPSLPNSARTSPSPTIRREDYRPPEWLVPQIELEFALGVEKGAEIRSCPLPPASDLSCGAKRDHNVRQVCKPATQRRIAM
jgi:hypothetical protein